MLKMKAFSVTEINRYIKRMLSTDPILNQVVIVGEISNFVRHSSGHAYFTLKDEQSKLTCVMFSQYIELLAALPRNGDRVQVRGQISVYERDGKYQLTAVSLENIGLGDLHLQFEKLKNQLREQGLFDPSHKKALPKLPENVGVITSPTGAAIQDIISVASRRSNFSQLHIYPVRVQGEFAKNEIISAIEYFNKHHHVDLIILARGGGSIEELWAFNEEVVARAIYQSEIPIITGIGHETDFTISDFVADYRAATPSAAAEIAIKSKTELILELNQSLQKLSLTVKRRIERESTHLMRYTPEMFESRIKKFLSQSKQHLNYQQRIFRDQARSLVAKEFKNLNVYGAKLESLSPLAVLNRGYSVAKKDGQWVTSITQVHVGDALNIQFKDGHLDVNVHAVNPET